MWVRSQDKEFLMKVDNINLGIDVDTNEATRLFTFVGGAVTSFTLGTYKSKERALEVLDEIQRLIEDLKYMEYAIDKNKFCGYRSNVYQMPEE